MPRRRNNPYPSALNHPKNRKIIYRAAMLFPFLEKLSPIPILISSVYSNIRVEEVGPLRYVKYAVFSREPEEDAIRHMQEWAVSSGISKPQIIGWDFPYLSQEQVNVFHAYINILFILNI